MSLSELAEKHNTDKLWHGYTPHYENHFAEYRDKPVMLLEIGVASGASMRMWDDWFTHERAVLVGVDIEPETPTDFGDRVQIIIGDGTEDLFTHVDYFDIIIDDGSHTSQDIINSMWVNWKHLAVGGWYVIEDLEVQWRNDYGGGGNGSPAIDRIHEYVSNLLHYKTGDVSEVHVYNEIVFLRKSE